MTRLSLPGDRRLQAAVDWGKQNVLDLTRASEDLQVRWLDQGNQYTAPLGTVERARWVGAGYPGLPVDVRHRRRVHGVRERRHGPVRGDQGPPDRPARRVGDPQRRAPASSPTRSISDGSNWFGDDSSNPTDGQYNFNTDETVKYPSAVALIWRWTGDDRFRHELYDFSVRGMRAVVDRLDEDGDGWPEGSGNVERDGMGVEKLDNSVYLIRGLYDLADLARAEGDRATQRVGERPRAPAAPAVRGRLVVSRARPTGRSTPTRSTTRRSAATTTSSRTSTGSA